MSHCDPIVGKYNRQKIKKCFVVPRTILRKFAHTKCSADNSQAYLYLSLCRP